jgi:hypothetical protein
VLEDKGNEAAAALKVLQADPKASPAAVKNQQELVDWWGEASKTAESDQGLVTGASLYGSRMALRITAVVPALMALIYLGMILYFRTKGGYRPQILINKHEEALLMAGGTAGPAEY